MAFGDYSDIEQMRQRQLQSIAQQGQVRRHRALNIYNAANAQGTVSGAMRGATEGIAGEEALQGAQVNEESAQLQHERQMEENALAEEKRQYNEAHKHDLIKGIINTGLNLATSAILPGGGTLLGAGLGKLGIGGSKAAPVVEEAAAVPAAPSSAGSFALQKAKDMAAAEGGGLVQGLRKRRRRAFAPPAGWGDSQPPLDNPYDTYFK